MQIFNRALKYNSKYSLRLNDIVQQLRITTYENWGHFENKAQAPILNKQQCNSANATPYATAQISECVQYELRIKCGY